jgi:hypothetical protein
MAGKAFLRRGFELRRQLQLEWLGLDGGAVDSIDGRRSACAPVEGNGHRLQPRAKQRHDEGEQRQAAP